MGTLVIFFVFLAIAFGLAVGLMFGLRAVKLI
jgi:hypothetical protein